MSTKGPLTSLNIWICDIVTNYGFIGIASNFGLSGEYNFPYKSPFGDGVYVEYRTLAGLNSYQDERFNLGFTTIHEVGHWLGLLHTFAGGCEDDNGLGGLGDEIKDTPAEYEPTFGCPADKTKDTCPQLKGYDPIHNFMDYSDDKCYTEFTSGQYKQMRYETMKYRFSYKMDDDD